MAKDYNRGEVESFVNGIVNAKGIIGSRNPDLLFAPMMGAVPLIDSLNAIDPFFDNSNVYYVPASSSVRSLGRILPEVVAQVLHKEFGDIRKKGLKILSLDEVVSGSSAVRFRNKVNEGLRLYAQEIGVSLEDIKQVVDFKQICLEHGAFLDHGGQWSPTYIDMRADNQVIPIRVKKIITMDNPALCPVKYKALPKNPSRNLPYIQNDFLLSEEYVGFLSEISSIVGTNPDISAPKTYSRILDHQRFIPEWCKTLEE